MRAVTVGDLNLDGNLDAIAAAPYLGGSNGDALLGNGDGTFFFDYWYSEFVAGADHRGVAVGDFTGDRIPDLVTAGSMVDVVPGRGDGRFEPPIRRAANGSLHTDVAITAATSDGDYVAKTGTLTFGPGATTKTITIEVKGDSKMEVNETFYLDLFDLSSNAKFTTNRGNGTILNDD